MHKEGHSKLSPTLGLHWMACQGWITTFFKCAPKLLQHGGGKDAVVRHVERMCLLFAAGLTMGGVGHGSGGEASCPKRLLDLGWQRQTLAFFDEMPKDEVIGLLPGIAEHWTEEEHKTLLREAKRQRIKMDLEDHTFLLHQRLLFKDRSFVDRKLEGTHFGEAQAGVALGTIRKTLPRVSWKTRADRMLGSGPTDELRQQVEEKERERWVGKLIEILERNPLVEEAEKKPERYKYFASRYAMGRRASTIRQHVRHGTILQEFMENTHGERWLRHEEDLIAHISLRMEEPCGLGAGVFVQGRRVSRTVGRGTAGSTDLLLAGPPSFLDGNRA